VRFFNCLPLRFGRFVGDITLIDSVMVYLDKRPELIDISLAPEPIIKGRLNPTGIQKTLSTLRT
jgi:hypothetical protein